MTTNRKAQLIQDCLKGKRKAQNMFYETHKRLVMGICHRYAKDNDDAKDIFQEAFIRIFKNLDKLNDHNALHSWIRQTTIRTAINFNTKYNATQQYHLDIELNDQEDKNCKNILNELSNEELVKCINLMPNGYRSVFNMYVIDGFKHKEIAEILNISENTSKSQLRSAKIYLRGILKKKKIIMYERAV